MRRHRDPPAALGSEVVAASGVRSTPTTRVYFHAVESSVSLYIGEALCVVGGHPALGNWNPSEGLVLRTNDDIFPCWISEEPIFVELGMEVEYKYVIVGAGSGDDAAESKENTGPQSFIASGSDMTIEDDNGLYRLKTNCLEDDLVNEEKPTGLNQMDMEQRLAYIRDLEGKVTLSINTTIFILSYSLPVLVKRNLDGSFSVVPPAPTDGRNFAFVPLLEEMRQKNKARIVSIGWPGIHVENMKERMAVEQLLQEHHCIPVFPPREEFEKFTDFCNDLLWPVFHDVMLFYQSSQAFSEDGWAAYQHMNSYYANQVVPHCHESDLVWIHDYHLMMAPTFIARKLHMANIGFFLHEPFPSSDGFKSLPRREELLSGLLSADQVGFQFFTYARNFMVSVKRVFGLDPIVRAGGFLGLEYNGREVMIKVGHFVYPFEGMREIACSEAVGVKATELRDIFQDRAVFASMDRCSSLSGLMPKFRAFRRFVRDHPEHKGKVALVQYCFLDRPGFESFAVKEQARASSKGASTELLQSVSALADAVITTGDNGKLEVRVREGVDPSACEIYLRSESMEHDDRIALFRMADVHLDTSEKAGLNLMPFEFVTAHCDDNAQERTSGVTIISEFSGSSRVLLGAIRVNPWNAAEIVSACHKAIVLPKADKADRHETNLTYVQDTSPNQWFEEFVTDLRRARKKEGLRLQSLGFGGRIRQFAVAQGFEKLDMGVVVSAFRASRNRVIFLDNEGTLAADMRHLYRKYGAEHGGNDLKSTGNKPCESVLDSLRSLCNDGRNTVVILSGRNQKMLEDWFDGVPRIGLAAERGFYYKLPLATGDQWHCMSQNPDSSWKTYASEIMRQFVKRTQGSFIENKGSALVWQYRDADPHFGSWQARELSSHLKELLFGFEVDVIDGKGYVEVKLKGIDKGVAVAKVLAKVKEKFGEADFVLAIGDDRSDEDMFKVVNLLNEEEDDSELSTTDGENDAVGRTSSSRQRKLSAKQGLGGLGSFGKGRFGKSVGLMSASVNDLAPLMDEDDEAAAPAATTSQRQRRVFTVTVGQKPSAAKAYLDDVDEVSELLLNLRSTADRRSLSNSHTFDTAPNMRGGLGRQQRFGNSQTWSGVRGGGLRGVGSMPSLSSVNFDPN